MKNHIHPILRFATLALFIFASFSCSKEERQLNSTSCHPDQAVIKTVTNETGTFGYDDGIKLTTLTVVSGNVTSVYFICNPPVTQPALNAQVTFSGSVRASTRPAAGNKTYYELTVTAFSAL